MNSPVKHQTHPDHPKPKEDKRQLNMFEWNAEQFLKDRLKHENFNGGLPA